MKALPRSRWTETNLARLPPGGRNPAPQAGLRADGAAIDQLAPDTVAAIARRRAALGLASLKSDSHLIRHAEALGQYRRTGLFLLGQAGSRRR